MSIIRDVMPEFELVQPANVDEAISALKRHGADAWALAGGLDSFDWFKDRAKRPKVVVDLSGIDELQGVRQTRDGLEIGAMTTLTELATHPVILEKYWVLAEAARKVASPQIRNQATIGGNVSQDTRCHYYRGGVSCYRAGGNTCYAATPTGQDREHCIFGGARCIAVNPSDVAPALIVLDAQMVIRNSRGERVVDAADYFVGPQIDIERMTVLRPGDLLTAIRVPNTWAGARFYFEKVTDRNAWDFPLVNVASAMMIDSSGVVSNARVSVNGVAPTPLRLTKIEKKLIGERAGDQIGRVVGELAVQGARPRNRNHYKVPLMKNLVRRAVRGGEA